jgi:tRNA threonylcarbamoyl adenosine modification protein YeaZ
MKILALDFSTSQRSVAVVQPLNGTVTAFQSEVVEVGGRSTKTFSMIDRALAEAHLEREDIKCVAVGLGPGSYTGIRAAIAIAQGWQFARGIVLQGISSVEVLAAQAHSEGVRGDVHIVVDAQRGEFYCATWHLSKAGRLETEPLHIVPRGHIESLLAAGSQVFGPDLKRAFPRAGDLFPGALRLGQLALGRSESLRGEQLVPVYLRETTFVKAPPPRQI